MAGCHDKIRNPCCAAQEGQTIRRTGPQSLPRLDTGEVTDLELREILRNRVDDSTHAASVNVVVQARKLHRAAKPQAAIHWCNGHTRFGENRTQSRQLA